MRAMHDENLPEDPFYEPDDVFSPHHFDGLFDDPGALRTLPAWAYTSRRFFNREMARVFGPNWNLLDRADRIPRAGDFFCVTYLGIPLLVVRGSDERVRVFANTCRHRGSLIAQGEGHATDFSCPYHGWTYSIDGALGATPNFEDAGGTPILDERKKTGLGLIEIPSAAWGGFIFIRLQPGSSSLAQHLGALPEMVAPYRPEDMICTRRKVFEIRSNWKLYFENFNEIYHIPFLHGGTINKQKRAWEPQPPAAGNFVSMWARHEGSRLVILGDPGFPAMSHLQGEHTSGTFYCSIFPATMFAFCNDGMFFVRTEPLAPDRTRLMIGSCFPADVVARDDFSRIAESYYRRVDRVTPEDYLATDLQQIGLASPFASTAQLCRYEIFGPPFEKWVLDQVLG